MVMMMITYKFKIGIKEDEFNDFVINFPNSNFMQHDAWAKVKTEWKSQRIGLYQGKKLIAVSLILKKSLPFGYKLYYCPRGFVIDYLNKKALQKFTEEINLLARKDRAIAIKIDPFICFNETYLNQENNLKLFSLDTKKIIANLKAIGFVHNGYRKNLGAYIQPRYTMVVPLIDEKKDFLTPEIIKNGFSKNVRNYIGDYHLKRGVEFFSSQDPHDLKKFMEILKCTESRQSISLRNENYFNKMMNNYPTHTVLFFAKINFDKYLSFLETELSNKKADQDFVNQQIIEVKNLITQYGSSKVVASSIVMMPICKMGVRVASFLYAGTNTDILPNLKVTNGLMYYRLCYALKEGCHYADLGGIDGSLTDHLSVFKSKFNPLVFELVGEYDLIINKKIYYFFNKLLPIAKKLFLKFRSILRKK